jgi:hypothetical protein
MKEDYYIKLNKTNGIATSLFQNDNANVVASSLNVKKERRLSNKRKFLSDDDNGNSQHMQRNDDSNDDDEDLEEDDDEDEEEEEDYLVKADVNSTHSDDLDGLANVNGGVRRKQHNPLR